MRGNSGTREPLALVVNIRTKLALALVSVALIGMAILGAFAYDTSRTLLQEISIRQLDALAESKKRDLEKVQEGWRDQLRLIKSRSRLLSNLKLYLEGGNEDARRAVVEIIEDSATAVDDVDQIRILDLDGNEVAAFGRVNASYTSVVPQQLNDVAYGDTFPDNAGGARVVFTSLLAVDDQTLGMIEIVFDAEGLTSVTDNVTGLGETGEVMIVKMEEDEDTVLTLNPLRHLDSDELQRTPVAKISAAVSQALSPDVDHGWLNSVDYRGVDVWAATRYLPDLQWGLIVKIDAAEEAERANRLRDALFDIALALSAFAIVGGTLLGFYLARPIHDLAVLVERVRDGETHLRAEVQGEDEIAYLAESVNELLDHMQEDSKNEPPNV